MVISLPPGHFKSFTIKNFSLWTLGKNSQERIISASNSAMAETFSTQVRDTILGINVGVGGTAYPEIFPGTSIKQGYATKAKWEIKGAAEPTYRVTTPSSAITGSRCSIFLCDDIIKDYAESLNARVLQEQWDWFRNTIYSRLDGDNFKCIFIMQRWANNDLAGHIIEQYGDDVEVISYPVINKDGSLLDKTIMSQRKLVEIRQTLSPEVFSANYLQKPVDLEGRLYESIKEYDALPAEANDVMRKAYIDTADTGTDYFCGMAYINLDNQIYILDSLFTQKPAEFTEPACAEMLTRNDVDDALFESNNGGRGFARNIERIMRNSGNTKTVVDWKATTANKEARILSSSAWVSHNVYMPKGWENRWPEMASQILSYVKGGRNAHDDALDVLAAIYETETQTVEYCI